MHGGGRGSVRAILDKTLGTQTSAKRQRQARDAPWSCGNQPAYHSMINRRLVPALHRACLHQRDQPGRKEPGGIWRPCPLKTDMTAFYRRWRDLILADNWKDLPATTHRGARP